MLRNVYRILIAILFLVPIIWFSCSKITPHEEPAAQKPAEDGSVTAARGDSSRITIRTNPEILDAVKTGIGGWALDGITPVEFPSYRPPVNLGNMLAFPSENDYNEFIKAVDLMQVVWNYSSVDYEDTPDEINHLGEEPLEALDTVLAFTSLRHKYELYEYYDHNWEDTVSINVEDDDYQIVMNTDHEVKIGDKFYKYVANNVIAVVSNNNMDVLKKVRTYGYLVTDNDLGYFNEDLGAYVKPFHDILLMGRGCRDFDIYAYANNLTPASTTDEWEVELGFGCYYSSSTLENNIVMGEYTIDWGDGSPLLTFTDLYYHPGRKRHTYRETVAPGNSVTKRIVVTCRMLNPTSSELFYCPDPTAFTISQDETVELTHPPPIDCMWGHIKRKFNGVEQYAGGTKYRLECKMVQKTSPGSPFANPKLKIKGTFVKWKNSRWKKTKPITSTILKLRGDTYNTSYCDVAAGTCLSLMRRLDEVKVTTKQKELKLKVVLGCFTTNRIMPFAINADFIWTYNRGQTLVGNYNEVLKP